MASNQKPMFHSPRKTGEVIKIPTAMPVKILSFVSLAILVILTAFAVFAVVTKGTQPLALSGGFYVLGAVLFITLPAIGWVVAIGFRLALHLIPLEMWRLPESIKKATLKTKGRYLKMAAVLLELEVAIGVGLITVSLYYGRSPGDGPVLIWVLVIVATIILCSRAATSAAQKA